MVVDDSFFQRTDVVKIAKDMIGMRIFTSTDGIITGGYITETEAYAGTTDKASHAYNGKFTHRTKVMYDDGGTVYIYLCYGIHSLLNIVTNKKDIPHAVLIRSISPFLGKDIMLKRLKKQEENKKTFYGPGNVSKALNINYLQSGIKLNKIINQSIESKNKFLNFNKGYKIWIEDRNMEISDRNIEISSRIGVDYAQEDALLPYRFTLKI
ncbi:MAG: DNA-3-methyladenine glycosylase [Bacteroidales bacterium]|jgi:DNA-3-methyladenine glycosylase